MTDDTNAKRAGTDLREQACGKRTACRRGRSSACLNCLYWECRYIDKGKHSDSSTIYRQIRACCALEEGLRESFQGELECDETTFGGSRKGKRGWGAAGKIIVFGILKRNGTVKVFPVQGRTCKEVISLVQHHTNPGRPLLLKRLKTTSINELQDILVRFA